MIFTSKEFVLAAGLAVSAFCSCGTAWGEEAQGDSRLPKLKKFFTLYRSPLQAHAGDFLGVADRYGLDWRLLPTLVIIESGGRNIRNNNVFGWGNGASRFRSVADSIAIVADCLANKLPYKGKTLEEKMRTYNPRRRDYSAIVSRIMQQIEPDERVLAASAVAGDN